MGVKVPRNESSRKREGYRERKSQGENWLGAKEPESEMARVLLANSGAKGSVPVSTLYSRMF